MAVQDIYEKLHQLSDAVAALETTLVAKEHSAKQKPVAGQIDMFAWSHVPSKNQDNSAVLAKKLDHTINRVQALLADAGGY